MSDSETPIDIYADYQKLRNESPVVKIDDGPWQVSRYEDVNLVLRDADTFSSDVSLRPPEERAPSMLFSDAPIHNRLRKLVSYAFKPSHIAAQRPLIKERCDELVTEMAHHRKVDIIQALAAPLPVTVIAHMLGVVDGDMMQFKQWSDAIFTNIADILFASPSPEAEKASEEMNAYFLELIAHLRDKPADHLLGRLVQSKTEDGELSDEELLSFCALLLIAGNETTTGLITASIRIFDEIPETFSQLKENPKLIPTFIEEALRYYSPFSATVRRVAKDTKLAGINLSEGELVIPLIASANRDESVFSQPSKFIIDRAPNPHLAFGFGVHFCLGAHLARLEGEIAVAALIEHFDEISLVEKNQNITGMLDGPGDLWVNIKASDHP